MPKSDDIPACPSIPVVQSQGREIREYPVELVTPMFGGGIEPRVNDPSFPVRPTAIRGQLEFWWRATVGAQYTTLGELRAAQSDIWGSTERASRVNVLVAGVQASEPTPCAKIEWNPRARQGNGAWRINWQAPFNGQGSSLPYALFPFQGETPPPNQNAAIDVPPAACIQQASFRVVVRCPTNLWPQVEPAVWAWVNFGGLGGRTRRGSGAITGREIDANGKTIKDMAAKDATDFVAMWKRYMPEFFPTREWPTLASPLILKPLALTSGKVVPLILRLKTPDLTGGELRQGDTPLSLPSTTVIRDSRLAAYPNSPLAGSPNGSALEAFLAYALTQGFTKVTA